ncbi:hypothetical protein V4P56_02710 [Bartonella sp. B35(2025)]
MQDWIIDNAIFLLHQINDGASIVAPVIITMATGVLALFVQQRSLKKQLKIIQRQTIASETQTAKHEILVHL